MTLIMDGRPQTYNRKFRYQAKYEGREIWLTWRCWGLLNRIVRAGDWIKYADLAESEFDRIGQVMYQLRKQLKAQGGPEIESRRVDSHHAEFRVKV